MAGQIGEAAALWQTSLWQGPFGDRYTERNGTTPAVVRALMALWSRVLAPLAGSPPKSILEVGSNVGSNLAALKLLTDAELFALEPNAAARGKLVESGILPPSHVYGGEAQDIPLSQMPGRMDLVFTSGVLIHIHPDKRLVACKEIDRASRRYIVCAEYFSDKPEAVRCRDIDGILFKRDFGDFWLSHFPDLRCLDYGFSWKRLTGAGQPDILDLREGRSPGVSGARPAMMPAGRLFSSTLRGVTGKSSRSSTSISASEARGGFVRRPRVPRPDRQHITDR